jgi:hypothetical protein
MRQEMRSAFSISMARPIGSTTSWQHPHTGNLHWENAMKTIIASALASFLAATTFCNAQPALKSEPMMMNRGTVVLVDDGSCPRGHIKQVGTVLATGVLTNPYGAVDRKCIPVKGEAASTVGR